MRKIIKQTSLTLVASSLVAQATIPATGLVGVVLVTASLSSKAHAGSKIDVGQSILEINANKPITSTNMFHMQNSNTVVLDVVGVDRTFDNVVVENDPLIEKVVTRIVGDKARLIITTKQPVKYSVEVDHAKIFAKFSPSEAFESLIPFTSPVAPKVVAEAIKNGNEWKEETKRVISEQELEKIVAQMRKDTNKTATEHGVQVTPLNVTETIKVQENVQIHELRKINLKKESSKITRIIFDLNTSEVSPEIQKSGDRLLINLPGVSIPSELQRRISTESLGTAVKVLDVTTQKNSGRISLEVANSWEYSFYQADKQLALIIKTVDSVEEAKKYTGKPLTISFQDIEVRALLQVIADFTNLNIMTSDNVQGSMTLRLKDVPWDQALDLVLDARGLQKIKEGNVIRIATNEEVEKSNESKLKLKNQGEALERIKLEFFPINYYKAEDLKSVLEGGNKEGSSKDGKSVSLLSNRGSIGVDVRNNILMVQDTEDSLQYVRTVIKKLDVPVRQVLIEAKIVIAEDSFGRELGSRFGIRGFNQKTNSSQGIGGNIVESGTVAGGTKDSIKPIDPVTPLTNLAAAALNGFSAGSIGFTLLNVSGNALGLELSALENKNQGKVLSSPRLLTTDNTKAVIEQGSEIPYITPASGDSPPTVSFKKAVLKLDVTPQITPNGRVIMDLEIRKDTIGQLVNVQGGGQVPSIDTRSINNKISVSNGQTVVLGGIYEITNRDDVTKIPFFGDIPVLGNFFKHKGKGEDKGELMIFITPHIIEDEDLDDATPVEINLTAKK